MSSPVRASIAAAVAAAILAACRKRNFTNKK